MDWNISTSSSNNNSNSNSKVSATAPSIMVAMRNENVSNSMPAIFYPRSNIPPGLEDHNSCGTPTGLRGDALLYTSFENSSDQESGDVDASDHEVHPVEKKRRLSVDQVRSLELNFEMENKLEPERKKQLAHELGLQPRQVAVWFQNRRARWKTKQLERDYEALKASYDTLLVENKKLQAEVTSLVAKLESSKPLSTSNDLNAEQKPEIIKPEEVSAVAAASVVAAGGKSVVVEDMDVVVTKSGKAGEIKEGSPCSDGYTSEILDLDCPVPAVQESVVSVEHTGVTAVAKVLKDEPDGMVFDPHSNQLVLYKFEDALLDFNSINSINNNNTSSNINEYDLANSYYYIHDGIGPWWT